MDKENEDRTSADYQLTIFGTMKKPKKRSTPIWRMRVQKRNQISQFAHSLIREERVH